MISSGNNNTTTAAQTQPKTNLSMISQTTKHLGEQAFTKTFQDKNEDHYYKLENRLH